jgi:hypothetical protein
VCSSDLIPYSGTQTMIDKLTALGGKPKLTNTNGWKHFSYAPTFQTAELLPWLFAQSKSGTSAISGAKRAVFSRQWPSTHLVADHQGILVGKATGNTNLVNFYNVNGALVCRGLVGTNGRIKPTEIFPSTPAR